ncbi:MAG: hypothetical protein N2171_06320 [Clostridia bacterium]|nr:hypothetical protein [Clostridia bacterium]
MNNVKKLISRLNNLNSVSAFAMYLGIAVSVTLIATSLLLLIVDSTVFLSRATHTLFRHSLNTAVSIFSECFILSAVMDIYDLKNSD